MGMEYELKFRTDEVTQQRLLAALTGSRACFQMKTAYFDTPSLSLSARKWTLRCRRENELAVCTLKTPGAGNARGEWEVEEADICKSIEKLCKLGAPQELGELCRAGLQCICGAEFTRTAVTVAFTESLLEVACDRGVLTGGGKTAPICEMEVELKEGKPADADTFAAALAREFSLTAEPRSKFRRALALFRGEA